MSVQVKRRRDTAANLASFTGAQAELLVDTTNNRVQVHDGVTPGGWAAAKLAEVVTNGRTAVADANYTALSTDRNIAFTAISAARTVTLPAAASYPTGTALTVFDESGSCSATNTITLARAGTDLIDGAASAVISASYGYLSLQSNGTNKWTIVDQWLATPLALASGGTNAATAAGARAASGLNIDALTRIADANYTASAADRKIAYTSISAARTVTLPAANALNAGQALDIIDHYGVCSSSLTLTAQASGTDTINGASSIIAATTQYGGTTLKSDGISKWSYVPASAAAAGVSSLNLLTGALSIAAGLGVGVSASGAAVTIANTSLPGGLINKFRNATLDVWQRGTSMTVGTAGAYAADGWIVVPAGASVAVAQSGGRLLTKNSLQISGASGVTDVLVKQRIESYIAAALCSQAVTVQAQIYNATGSALTPLLTVKHAGSQDSWSSPATDVSAVSLQSCASGAWTQVAYTFSASAASYNGLEVSFDFGNNFAATGKSIQIAEADIRVTPGVATGLNATPPPAELRPIATEQPFCARYYQTSYANGTTPGTATRVGMVVVTLYAGGTYAASFNYPTVMRAAPSSVSNWDGAGNAGKTSYNSSGTWTDNLGANTYPQISQNAFLLYNTGNGVPAFQYAVSAEL